METELEKKLAEQEQKLDAIFKSVERMRLYFKWTLIITVATVVLPLIGLAIILPWFLRTMTAAYSLPL